MQLFLALLIYGAVDILLIKGVSGLFRLETSMIRIIIGTIISVGWAFLCVKTKDSTVNGLIFYFGILLLVSLIVFGFGKGKTLPSLSFVLFYISFGGLGFHYNKILSLFIGSIGVVLVSMIARKYNHHKCVWVKIRYNDQDYSMKALLDSGNMLTDPVTGRPVLVVGVDIAQKMTGLSINQIQNPVQSINAIPGLRLIPYRTIGQSGVFLLGLPVKKMQIGGWQGSGVIALSPEILSANGTFQALTGGFVR